MKNDLQVNENDEARELSNISPIGTKLRALLEHRVITTETEYETFRDHNSDHAEFLDDVLSELIERGKIQLSEGQFTVQKGGIWASSNPKDLLKSLPELSREISKNALMARSSGSFDPDLDFSIAIHFANDPAVIKQAREILYNCYHELRRLALIQSENSKNDGVRIVSFSATHLSSGRKS